MIFCWRVRLLGEQGAELKKDESFRVGDAFRFERRIFMFDKLVQSLMNFTCKVLMFMIYL